MRLYDSELWQYVYLAFVESKKEKVEESSMMYKTLFWIANIQDYFNTSMLKGLGAKMNESIGARLWEKKEEADGIEMLDRPFESWELDMWG